MDSTQLLKGVLDIAILATLSRRDDYGYALVTELRSAGFENVGEASVYGTLRRLTADGSVSNYSQPSDSGPNRKYYTLTEHGRQQFELGAKSWHHFSDTMYYLLTKESR